jgi:protein tyrosine phosphatase
MIKQQRVRVVAMVTNEFEMGRPKCARYWPERVGETSHYPESPEGRAVSVTCTQVHAHSDPGMFFSFDIRTYAYWERCALLTRLD